MTYVRKKKTKGKEYYQLVEGRRESGKVKQHVLAHLGDTPTVEDALRGWQKRIDRLRKAAEENRKKVKWVSEKRPDLMVRRKAVPHTYASANKMMDDFEVGTPEFRSGLDTRIRREYWQHTDYAERLEREAVALEERLAKLQELRKQGKA